MRAAIALTGAIAGTTASGLAAMPATAAPALPHRPVVPQDHVREYVPSYQAAVSHQAFRQLSSRTVTVRPGDTLWGLAQRFLGGGSQWPRLYAANEKVVGSDPNLIRPGEQIHLVLAAHGSFGGSAPVAVPARAGEGEDDGPASGVTVSGTASPGAIAGLAGFQACVIQAES